MNNKLAALFLLIFIVGCTEEDPVMDQVLPFYNDAALTPEWVAPAEPRYSQIHAIAPFYFENQLGEYIGSELLDGKIYVANFFFANCTKICPSMRSNLQIVQEEYMKDDAVQIVSHTVLPEKDTVPILQAYAAANNIAEGKWHLVTGAKHDIYTLAQNSYFANIEGTVDTGFLHTETFYLIDGKRRIRGVYNGTLAFDVNRLIEDIAILKEERAV